MSRLCCHGAFPFNYSPRNRPSIAIFIPVPRVVFLTPDFIAVFRLPDSVRYTQQRVLTADFIAVFRLPDSVRYTQQRVLTADFIAALRLPRFTPVRAAEHGFPPFLPECTFRKPAGLAAGVAVHRHIHAGFRSGPAWLT